MAQTTGPLFSITAKGTIGNALTFQTWKGKTTTRKKPDPHNVDSLAQRIGRAGVTIANALWSDLANAEKEAWQSQAQARNITPYNAQVSDALARKANNQAPQRYPGATGDWSGAGLNSFEVTLTEETVELMLDFGDELLEHDNYAIGISTIGFADAQDFSNAILARIHPGGYGETVEFKLPPPGTYYLALIPFGDNGQTSDEIPLTDIEI